MTEEPLIFPFSLNPFVLIGAFFLDLAIGDPVGLPHPVRAIGYAISRAESLLLGQPSRVSVNYYVRLKGVLLVLFVVGGTFFLTWFVVQMLQGIAMISKLMFYGSIFMLVYLTSTTIATKELIKSTRLVIEEIKKGRIDLARKNLSVIVGRDTEKLSEKEILKATIETLSENLSDGIVAPLFYLVIGGLPFAMAYKAINTLDSMVGYKNERYKDFGWASARLDDIANYMPARISGVLIGIASFIVFRSWAIASLSFRTMIQDGRKHISPNAGVPEAAIAGALGVQLGGSSTYNGVVVHKPYIGVERIEDYLPAAERALDIIKISSFLGAGVAVSLLYIGR